MHLYLMAQAAVPQDTQLILHRIIGEVKRSLQQSQQVRITEFMINLILATLLALLLGMLYVKFGSSLSNRKSFAANFILVAMTTMLIITLVKSSLALSLGLVGALSIVRFRTAIKEPEELSYMFVAIAIGLGFGAHQGLVTSLAFGFIALVICIRSLVLRRGEAQAFNLVVSARSELGVSLDQIVEVLKQTCAAVHMQRFDQADGILEASFVVSLPDYPSFEKTADELLALNGQLGISYLDHRGSY